MEEKRKTEDVLDDIILKLSVYDGKYNCKGCVNAEVSDGNRFDVHEIRINEDGYVEMEFYSEITDSFFVDEFATIENLEEICDAIEAPSNLFVQVFINTGSSEVYGNVYDKPYSPDLEPDEVLRILQEQFPAIYWCEDGQNKWEGVPKTINNDCKPIYFVATFGDEF